MAATVSKGLLCVLFFGTMSSMVSAQDNKYPDDAAAVQHEKEESRFLFGTATANNQDVSITLGNEALLLIPLAFLGLLLLGAVVATLFGIGGAGETGPTGYDSYSTYDVMRNGLDHGYQALEQSSYAIARSLAKSAEKYL